MSKLRHVNLYLLVLGVVSIIFSMMPTAINFAQPATQTKKRTAVFGKSGAKGASGGLLQTFQQTGFQGGGEEARSGRDSRCPALLADESTPVYLLSPGDNIIYLNHPYYYTDLVIIPCQDNDIPHISIKYPDGTSAIAEKSYETSNYNFDIPDYAPTGDYELTINTGTTVIRKLLRGVRTTQISTGGMQPSGKITIKSYDAELKEPISTNQALTIEYSGWRTGAVVVGLYGFRNHLDFEGFELLDTWQIALVEDQLFSEEITIPTDAVPGRYYLIACAIESCNSKLREDGPWTYFDHRYIVIEPLIAWQEFCINDCSEAPYIPLPVPLFTKPTEAQSRSLPNLFKFQDSTVPTTKSYEADVRSNETRSWTFAWCAASKKLLPEIMAPLTDVTMLLEGNPVPSNAILEYEGNASTGSGWYCHFWSTLVSEWPQRPLAFELQYQVTERFYDGATYYSPGHYYHLIDVNVLPQ